MFYPWKNGKHQICIHKLILASDFYAWLSSGDINSVLWNWKEDHKNGEGGFKGREWERRQYMRNQRGKGDYWGWKGMIQGESRWEEKDQPKRCMRTPQQNRLLCILIQKGLNNNFSKNSLQYDWVTLHGFYVLVYNHCQWRSTSNTRTLRFKWLSYVSLCAYYNKMITVGLTPFRASWLFQVRAN